MKNNDVFQLVQNKADSSIFPTLLHIGSTRSTLQGRSYLLAPSSTSLTERRKARDLNGTGSLPVYVSLTVEWVENIIIHRPYETTLMSKNISQINLQHASSFLLATRRTRLQNYSYIFLFQEPWVQFDKIYGIGWVKGIRIFYDERSTRSMSKLLQTTMQGQFCFQTLC